MIFLHENHLIGLCVYIRLIIPGILYFYGITYFVVIFHIVSFVNKLTYFWLINAFFSDYTIPSSKESFLS